MNKPVRKILVIDDNESIHDDFRKTLIGPAPGAALAEDEPVQALENAVRLVGQVQTALTRVQAEHRARGH